MTETDKIRYFMGSLYKNTKQDLLFQIRPLLLLLLCKNSAFPPPAIIHIYICRYTYTPKYDIPIRDISSGPDDHSGLLDPAFNDEYSWALEPSLAGMKDVLPDTGVMSIRSPLSAGGQPASSQLGDKELSGKGFMVDDMLRGGSGKEVVVVVRLLRSFRKRYLPLGRFPGGIWVSLNAVVGISILAIVCTHLRCSAYLFWVPSYAL